jgi:YteA family regulatory protein
MMLSQEQQQQLQQQLMEEKKRLEERLTDNHHYGKGDGMNNSIGELSGYDNHPADIGTELFERGKDLALNEEDEHHLEEIEMALLQMEAGHYGTCVVCGKEIPYERLEAVPETSLCIEHQTEKEVSHRRPVEEKVLRPPYGRHFNDGTEQNAYDGEDAWQEVEQYGTSNPPDFFREGKNYNELVIDNDERRGYVDDFEGFAITDARGDTEEITDITHNDAYRRADAKERAESESNE